MNAASLLDSRDTPRRSTTALPALYACCTHAHLFAFSRPPVTIIDVTLPGRSPRVADVIRDELVATIDPTAADERLLVDLAASAASIAFQVNVATDRLAHVLPETLADPRRAVAVAKVLHELAVVGNTLVRRVESALSTAATLRVQRRVRRGAGE